MLAIALPGPASYLQASSERLCAFVAASGVLCWDADHVPEPVAIPDLADSAINQLAVSASSVCVLTLSGAVLCDDGPRVLPEPAARLAGSCALLASGRILCDDFYPFGLSSPAAIAVGATETLICARYAAPVSVSCAPIRTPLSTKRRQVTLSDLSPVSLQPGATLTLSGSGFGTIAALASVLVGGLQCAILAIADIQITCNVPWILPRSYNVWVTVSSEISNSQNVGVLPVPNFSLPLLRSSPIGLSSCVGIPELGVLYCLGRNDAGQRGIGSTVADITPRLAPVGGPFYDIALGFEHICAITTPARALRCWGDNTNGQLGYGHTNNLGDSPGEMPPPDVAVGGQVTQAALGTASTCALLTTGSVKCWGNNVFGQLGLGNSVNQLSPNASVDLTGYAIASIASGTYFVCILSTTGQVACWGGNFYGELGIAASNVGDQPNELPPVAVALPTSVAQLSCGQDFSCALLSDASVRCWGRNGFGQLGIGNINSIGDQSGEMPPASVILSQPVFSLSLTGNAACAVYQSGQAACWGSSSANQLGLGFYFAGNVGDEPGEMPPNLVTYAVDQTIHSIFGGYFHVCTLSTIGDIVCWGDGTGFSTGVVSRVVPPVSGLFPPLLQTVSPAAGLSLGDTLTLVGANFGSDRAALSISVGGVDCPIISSNLFTLTCTLPCGVFGTVSTSVTRAGFPTSNSITVAITNSGPVCPTVTAVGPSTAASGSVLTLSGFNFGASLGAISVSVGAGTCTPLSVNATVLRCQLPGLAPATYSVQLRVAGISANAVSLNITGTAPTITSVLPASALPGESVVVSGNGLFFAGISAFVGGVVMACNTTSATQWICIVPEMMPRNYSVYIGPSDGSLQWSSNIAPLEVRAVVGLSALFYSIAGALNCENSGYLVCWGLNDNGQLGIGNIWNIGDSMPELPPGRTNVGDRVIAVSFGYSHACAITSVRTIRCWGQNPFGELGYGHTNNIGDQSGEMPPGDVAIGGLASQVRAGQDSSCALLVTGLVKCWGLNHVGQLGLGDTTTKLSPTLAANLTGYTVSLLAVGSSIVCILSSDGQVACWGDNSSGQLGLGHTNDIGDQPGEMPPTAISLGGTALSVSLGGSFACALLALDNSVRCWGVNGQGQLGIENTATIGDEPGEMPPSPVKLGVGAIVQLSVGQAHVCVLTAHGRTLCWGMNNVFQLGIGLPIAALGSQAGSMPPPILDLGVASAIFSGAESPSVFSTTCALMATTAELKCWGSNLYGNLALGTDVVKIGGLSSDMPPESAILAPLITAVSYNLQGFGGVVEIVGYRLSDTSFQLSGLNCSVISASVFGARCTLPQLVAGFYSVVATSPRFGSSAPFLSAWRPETILLALGLLGLPAPLFAGDIITRANWAKDTHSQLAQTSYRP
eukprot:TRINITY_DN1598_c0_g1_i3.p1 TRINITY_DN1598_c0_g1~~TRINITY_DN1598_c0_g1_i3.p1  ORF type:complete len:1507 (+),score=330.55 TRINITY_DN1598_c0_g1_i3:348-4523(+)